MTLDIRDPLPGDETDWRRLWAGYLAFYKVDLADHITAHTWSRILDPQSRVAMRLAFVDGEMAGFAIHHWHDSTWEMTPDCYLEDLYLDARFRGRGVGRALINDLIALGKAKGWTRLYWHTNHDNATARKLYDRYTPADGFVRYRVELA